MIDTLNHQELESCMKMADTIFPFIGLDLLGAIQKMWKCPDNIDSCRSILPFFLLCFANLTTYIFPFKAVEEAFSKLDIIEWITSKFEQDEATKKSTFIIEAHDLLLQESSPMKAEKLQPLLSRCSECLKAQDENTLEIKLACAILHRYSSIYPKIRESVNFQRSQNEIFRNRYEFEGLVQEITYLKKHHYFVNYKLKLSPFSGKNLIGMEHIQNVIHSMIRAKKDSIRFGITTYEERKIQEDLVISLLRRHSNHIEGGAAYLEEMIQWNSKS